MDFRAPFILFGGILRYLEFGFLEITSIARIEVFLLGSMGMRGCFNRFMFLDQVKLGS